MLMMHQTGAGHKQLPDAQNAELYEGYSILIPHPENVQLFLETIKTISALRNQWKQTSYNCILKSSIATPLN